MNLAFQNPFCTGTTPPRSGNQLNSIIESESIQVAGAEVISLLYPWEICATNFFARIYLPELDIFIF